MSTRLSDSWQLANIAMRRNVEFHQVSMKTIQQNFVPIVRMKVRSSMQIQNYLAKQLEAASQSNQRLISPGSKSECGKSALLQVLRNLI